MTEQRIQARRTDLRCRRLPLLWITTPLLRVSRRFIVEVSDGLVPARQRRGLTRRTYSAQTLRGQLLEF